ncbi:XDD4 family exosortase-dependent surface protein [Rubrivivax gelatinosus]|uniref:Putative secreted protein with PEP-CTERM sorting signal n=1 Tax=Rubrivivax gelatinosus TaxID=28068 RepID=A0A4R2M1L8_RUBGE|nr:XDD4 family exosortase-dependent surface protein [Rubrivivax gelatinosus]MBK1689162.1 PEP-CTERM sorting domain-containing protein [Rubrivivax gelatinosus]TCO97986.1 putative secreted protein with PEP-CTERM sorting signal [Rubrivivax gelatinosus]
MPVKKKLISLALAACACTGAWAAPVSFSGSQNNLSASVSFDLVGSQLKVVLANTGTSDVRVADQVLTAVFFDLGGGVTLSPVSAISGGTTYKGTQWVSDAGTNVGGEWAFDDAISAYGAHMGISSSGLGNIFGPKDRFDVDSNLYGPESPDGLQYGITSPGDDRSTGTGQNNNGGGVFNSPLTTGSVIFLFDVAGPLDLDAISKVTFQYGTALDEPNFAGTLDDNGGGGTDVPEPATLALAGSALLGLAAARRRRRG